MEKVIAMVVDTKMITLYRPDGSKIEIPQGSPNIRNIVDTVLPIVNAGGIAEVDLGGAVTPSNPYREFESMASGLVRFFRVAKKVVAPLLTEIMEELEKEEGAEAPTVTPMTVGSVPASSPAPSPAPTQQPIASDAPRPAMAAAVDEIINNAESTESLTDRSLGDDETVVAVVGDKAIPGVEQLAGQFSYSARLKNTKGVENLIKRMAVIADKRMHSVQDLLRFLEKADLPIADDGSIIAYKSLNSRKNGVFVDCHTNSVKQRIGSFVIVDEKYVDKNRRNECSNGLHIARRAYLRNFGGDVLTLCKIEPEDVIVVPHNDPNKVRVCAYHIIAKLDEESRSLIMRDKPMTKGSKGAKVLADAIAGRHIGRVEEVRINGPKGKDVTITPLTERSEAKAAVKAKPKPTTKHTALDDLKIVGEKSSVDPKKVAAEQAKGISPRIQKARDLMAVIDDSSDYHHRKAAALKLIEHKKKSKVSWANLGISEGAVAEIEAAAQWVPARTTSITAPVAETRNVRARRLFKEKNWNELWDLKRKSKISWLQLGFSEKEIDLINKNQPENN